MDADSPSTRLRGAIDDLGAATKGMGIYLFGSSLLGPQATSDIDVLLVYADGDLSRAHQVAESLRNWPLLVEFDVTALSESEEAELNFVASVGAVRL